MGWIFNVLGVTRGSKSGLMLCHTTSLSYPESTRMAPARDSKMSPSTYQTIEKFSRVFAMINTL